MMDVVCRGSCPSITCQHPPISYHRTTPSAAARPINNLPPRPPPTRPQHQPPRLLPQHRRPPPGHAIIQPTNPPPGHTINRCAPHPSPSFAPTRLSTKHCTAPGSAANTRPPHHQPPRYQLTIYRRAPHPSAPPPARASPATTRPATQVTAAPPITSPPRALQPTIPPHNHPPRLLLRKTLVPGTNQPPPLHTINRRALQPPGQIINRQDPHPCTAPCVSSVHDCVMRKCEQFFQAMVGLSGNVGQFVVWACSHKEHPPARHPALSSATPCIMPSSEQGGRFGNVPWLW